MKQPVSQVFAHHAAMATPQPPEVSFGGDGFGFDDFLDMINPLQHLPVIGTLYRALTGDEISGEARLVGGGVFGGPVGLALAAADLVFEDLTGDNFGDTVMAAVFGPGADEDMAVAQADEAALEPAAPPPQASAAPIPLLGGRPASAPGVPELSAEAFAALVAAIEPPRPAPDANAAAPPASPDVQSAADAYAAALGAMERNLARYQAQARGR